MEESRLARASGSSASVTVREGTTSDSRGMNTLQVSGDIAEERG